MDNDGCAEDGPEGAPLGAFDSEGALELDGAPLGALESDGEDDMEGVNAAVGLGAGVDVAGEAVVGLGVLPGTNVGNRVRGKNVGKLVSKLRDLLPLDFDLLETPPFPIFILLLIIPPFPSVLLLLELKWLSSPAKELKVPRLLILLRSTRLPPGKLFALSSRDASR